MHGLVSLTLTLCCWLEEVDVRSIEVGVRSIEVDVRSIAAVLCCYLFVCIYMIFILILILPSSNPNPLHLNPPHIQTGPFSFIPFAIVLFSTLLFVIFVLPETQGRSIDQIQKLALNSATDYYQLETRSGSPTLTNLYHGSYHGTMKKSGGGGYGSTNGGNGGGGRGSSSDGEKTPLMENL